MANVISQIFGFLSVAFDKIPFLNKLKGWRSIIGFVGMAVVAGLKLKGIGDPSILDSINLGLLGWVGLSLNAKGRE